MALKHYDHDGRVRFVSFTTREMVPVLTNECFRDIVVAALKEVCAESRVKIIAYVIMPEHVHLMLLPPIEATLGPIIGDIKRLSAKQIHETMASDSLLVRRLTVARNGQTKFALWQKRCFDHNCRTLSSVRKKIEYCHMNPVRRGLVREPHRWKWSSVKDPTCAAIAAEVEHDLANIEDHPMDGQPGTLEE